MFMLIFLIVQPVISKTNCSLAKDCTSKCLHNKKGDKPESENRDCNPLLACSVAVWLPSPKITVSQPKPYIQKEKHFIFNDNRIVKTLSSLFHPPNLV